MKCSRFFKLGVLVLVLFLAGFQLSMLSNSDYYFPIPTFFNNVTSPNSMSSDSPISVVITRWILTLWAYVGGDGRSVMVSKPRTDILLLVRKLVIFSVKAVNLRLAGTRCAPWWVNPLSVTEFSETVLSNGVKEYNLTFEVQPGAVPFTSVVHLSRDIPNATHPFPSPDLLYVDAKRLDKGSTDRCWNSTLPQHLDPICLCPEEKKNAEKVTAEARAAWAEADPELNTWPPYVSMTVPDYIRFSTMDLYLKNPAANHSVGFCGPAIKMLVFISSAPTHFAQRAAIRRTFGNFRFLEAIGVRLLFLFGRVKDKKLQNMIDQEFLAENDIVQADFRDSYHNLTLSHLSMYNWVVTHCAGQTAPMPRWLLKADDDFFLNVPLALRIVEANPKVELIGILFCGTKAIRDVALMRKYYVSRYMYAPDYYAGYVSGVAYLVRTDVLEPMLKASLNTPIIHMDDAYVMGLLTREAGIRPLGSSLITYLKASSPCDYKNMMSNYVTHELTLDVMWAKYQEPPSIQCKFDESQLKVTVMDDNNSKFCLYT